MIIGIDPGQKGGIEYFGDDLKPLGYWCISMPDTPAELAKELNFLPTDVCYLEAVHSMPGQGVASSFKFGRNFGEILGVLAALQIRTEMVRPQVWQKAPGCMSGGDKNVTKRKALELFPGLKVTHSTADALLICEYGRRKEAGCL